MSWRVGLLVLALLAASTALADEPDPEETAAAWKKSEVDFFYMGFTTRYTCGGLKSKVKLLLNYVGVRPDMKIMERGCEYGYQKVADFPRLKIVFYAPAIPEPGSHDVGEPVLGLWKPVSIKRNAPRGLDGGDCELVEQFRDRVLSKLTTRNPAGDINCIPHQLIGNRIDLRFEVLVGAPTADFAKAQSP
ncbi:MAG: hypothetical protein EXR87_06315 [Gammaproteobacteria bacterium]|nr:hypothetical protein [Gammaproteobacteria bacterium]